MFCGNTDFAKGVGQSAPSFLEDVIHNFARYESAKGANSRTFHETAHTPAPKSSTKSASVSTILLNYDRRGGGRRIVRTLVAWLLDDDGLLRPSEETASILLNDYRLRRWWAITIASVGRWRRGIAVPGGWWRRVTVAWLLRVALRRITARVPVVVGVRHCCYAVVVARKKMGVVVVVVVEELYFSEWQTSLEGACKIRRTFTKVVAG